MKTIRLFAVLLLMCLTPTVLAQTDCPAIVKAALSAADSSCSSTGRNQACYGNIQLNAMPRTGTANFQFQQPGDKVDVSGLQSLQLSSMDNASGLWGVAVMRLQANLPNTLPGQNVTFLLFGDVSITDASEQLVELPVTTTSGVNVRLRPTTNTTVIQSLKEGQTVTAVGRLADSSWIHVRLDDGSVGWVAADFLNGDLYSLIPTDPNAPAFGPMQAFYFTTGREDSPCELAPDSGILIQTPKGAGTIQLRANDVDIQLGSTVYLQAVPGDALYVNVIEGHAVLTAQGQTQIVPPGTVGAVPLDSSGKASGAPKYPEPYAFQRLKNLPVYSQLFTPVKVQRAIARSNIDGAIAAITGSSSSTPTTLATNNGSAAPTTGSSGSSQWVQNETVTYNTCPGPLQVGDTNTWNPNIVFSADRQTFTYDGGPNSTTVTLAQSGGSTYQGVFGEETFTFNFTSPTTYTFSWVGVHGDPNNGGCKFVMDANANLVSGSPR